MYTYIYIYIHYIHIYRRHHLRRGRAALQHPAQHGLRQAREVIYVRIHIHIPIIILYYIISYYIISILLCYSIILVRYTVLYYAILYDGSAGGPATASRRSGRGRRKHLLGPLNKCISFNKS